MIDAHIHLEQYTPDQQKEILQCCSVEGMVAVSTDLASCHRSLQLARQYPDKVYAAFGYHPEQKIPADLSPLFAFIRQHQQEMVAIGEVGLPYYTRKQHEQTGRPFSLQPYVRLLEEWILLAAELDKPLVLHAVHEDAALACELLEKHPWHKVHFHWYKGRAATTEHMVRKGYFISITPDVLYKQSTQELARTYPLEKIMVETDGPWPYPEAFASRRTHPDMVENVIHKIAQLRQLPVHEVKTQITANTRLFYHRQAAS